MAYELIEVVEEPGVWYVRDDGYPQGEQLRARFHTEGEAVGYMAGRAALEVLMRRCPGELLLPTIFSTVIMVHPKQVKLIRWINSQGFTDPFTAIVETDKWIKLNVENK